MQMLKVLLEDSVSLIQMNIDKINVRDQDALDAMDDILLECNNILEYLGNHHEGLRVKLECTPQPKREK